MASSSYGVGYVVAFAHGALQGIATQWRIVRFISYSAITHL